MFRFAQPFTRVMLLLALVVLAVACAAPTAAPTSAPPTKAPVATSAPAPAATTAPAATAVPATKAPDPTKPAAAATNFRIAIGVDMDTLDPAGQTTTTVSNVVDYSAETLVTIDEKGETQPLLAKSWDVSKDGLTYTFVLQSGVKFHDGKAFDANAAKMNIERILDPDVKVGTRGPFMSIGKVEAVDASTVRITLKTPFPALLQAFSMTTSGMLSPTLIEKTAATYKNITQPTGTGPYVLKEYTKGAQLVFAKNADYWGKKPYYDTVTIRIVPEAATRESLLLANQVDAIILPPISDVPALQRNSAVKVITAPSNRIIFISINNTVKGLDNPKVRQALNYAVDKEAIIKSVMFSAGYELDAPMAPSLFGYCKVGSYAYDVNKAKALLKEANITAPLKLAFISPTGRYVQDFQASQAVAGYLKEVGVETDLKTMDWPSYVATITKPVAENTTNLHLLGWAPGFLDASQQMTFFSISQHVPKGLATHFYTNADVDKKIQAADAEIDAKKRAELYCDINKTIWNEAPVIFLWNQAFPIVHSAKVKNVTFRPNEKFYAIYAEPAN
ncbi:MAG: ABC transporter substrate-binding protein [Chloroflexi bacterium]|nr:ABC transporter substrate-binding protein [Chloroflexota bacterium]